MSVPFMSTLVSRAWRINNLYKIKSKQKRTISFVQNPLQIEIEREIAAIREVRKPIRLIILKPRQVGCTTFFGIRNLDRAMTRRNQFAAIIAHEREKAHEIFNEIVKFSYDNLDSTVREVFNAYNDSVNQLGWRSIASQIKVTFGGSGITPNLLHLTEVARMRRPKDTISEASQGVPRDGGEIIQESTANGKGGYFYDVCQEARANPGGIWRFLFLKWWQHPDYRLPVPANFELDEEEVDLLKRYAHDGLSLENLAFRREKIDELFRDKTDEETGLSGKQLFRQNYPMTPDEAFITSSLSIFNIEALEFMRQRAPEPIERRQWGNGWFKAFEAIEPGKFYVIGCDPSEGQNKSYSCAVVMERETGRIVASLRGKYISYDLARYLDKLGKFYNNALVVVERNMGHAVLNELINHIGYRMLYYHHDYDEHGRRVRKPGFPTSGKTRPIILSKLEKAIEDRFPIIPDLDIIEECLNFGYVGSKAQAVHGTDDAVLALAITNYICQQPTSMILPPDGGIEKPAGL